MRNEKLVIPKVEYKTIFFVPTLDEVLCDIQLFTQYLIAELILQFYLNLEDSQCTSKLLEPWQLTDFDLKNNILLLFYLRKHIKYHRVFFLHNKPSWTGSLQTILELLSELKNIDLSLKSHYSFKQEAHGPFFFSFYLIENDNCLLFL